MKKTSFALTLATVLAGLSLIILACSKLTTLQVIFVIAFVFSVGFLLFSAGWYLGNTESRGVLTGFDQAVDRFYTVKRNNGNEKTVIIDRGNTCSGNVYPELIHRVQESNFIDL